MREGLVLQIIIQIGASIALFYDRINFYELTVLFILAQILNFTSRNHKNYDPITTTTSNIKTQG